MLLGALAYTLVVLLDLSLDYSCTDVLSTTPTARSTRYASCIWLFCWFELYAPTVQRPWLYWALTALAISITVLHSMSGYVEEFQITFGILVLVGYVSSLS